MIGKIWQRLIKETMIKLYHEPRTSFVKPFPVYYFAFDGNIERAGLAVQSLQQIPQIPWPADNCVILAEDVALSLLTPDAHGLVWIIYTKNFKQLLGHPDESELFQAGATYLFGDRIIRSPSDFHYLRHISNPEAHFHNFVDPEESRSRAMQVLLQACERQGLKPSPENYGKYLDAVLVSDHKIQPHWVAYNRSRNQAQPGLAADILAYLANLAIPCHYMMRSRPEKGYGPTGEIKRLTRDKPIFSIIPHERLFHVFEGGHNGREVSPHPRDGHIRHLWLKGIPPLNRMYLPDSAIERIKLVHKHQVPRIYIHPTWIGDPEFKNEAFSFEVITGEMPLRFL